MPLVTAIFVVQLLLAGILLNSPAQSKQASIVKHTVKRVLGASFLADDTQPAATDQPTTDQSNPSSSDQSQTSAPSPSPDSSNASQPQPTSADTSQSSPNNTSLPPSNTQEPTQAQDTTQPPVSDQQPTISDQPTQTLPAGVTPDQTGNTQPSTFDLNTQQNSIQPSSPENPDQSLLQETTSTDTPSAQPSPAEQQTSSSPTQTDSPTISNTVVDTSSSSDTGLTTTSQDTLTSSASTLVTNPDNVIANPQTVNEQVLQQSHQEDTMLAKAQTPQQHEATLIAFAKDKVIGINQSLQANDFATSSFVTQRLNMQLDQAINTANSAPAQASAQARKTLQSFCKQADLALKTEQVSVPEDLEQDIIIARGKCLDITQ